MLIKTDEIINEYLKKIENESDQPWADSELHFINEIADIINSGRGYDGLLALRLSKDKKAWSLCGYDAIMWDIALLFGFDEEQASILAGDSDLDDDKETPKEEDDNQADRHWRDDNATEKQISYLRSLGYEGKQPDTKGGASDLIDQLRALRNSVGGCHYCGSPARSHGFFGEPCCEECGG